MDFSQIIDQVERNIGMKDSNPGAGISDSIKYAVNKVYLALAGKMGWSWWLTSFDVAMPDGLEAISLPPICSRVWQIRDADNKPISQNDTLHSLKFRTRVNAMGKRTASLGPVSAFTYFKDGTVSIAQDSDVAVLSGGVWPADVVGRCLTIPNDNEYYIITERTDDLNVVLHSARVGTSVVDSAFQVDKQGTTRLMLTRGGGVGEVWTFYFYFVPPELVLDTDEPILPVEFHSYLIDGATAERFAGGQKERKTVISDAEFRREETYGDMLRTNASRMDGIRRSIGVTA